MVVGVDEAGRGPWAGPVVAAAVVFEPTEPLLGLRDSKQLTFHTRVQLAHVIQQQALSLGIGVVQADDIDHLNILQATFQAMRAALTQLTLRLRAEHALQPDLVLVDGWPIPKLPDRQVGVIQGDTLSASIAAASILAKVTRDHLMEQWDVQFPEYGFRRHKGYGTFRHRTALDHFGPSPIHRRSFAPVRRWCQRPNALFLDVIPAKAGIQAG
ncbi:MAG: ribonuclease HII [Elusimicrobia bacterium]|nr:ribonuclease HII [Elusimicrobiota bacterium]